MVQLTINSNPVSDLQLEKRRELEKKLADEERDLDLLQSGLKKTAILTSRMDSMLTSFDTRLARLETSFILPIHNSTSKLTRLHTSTLNITTDLNSAISLITTYTNLCNNVTSHELVVSKGYLIYNKDA